MMAQEQIKFEVSGKEPPENDFRNCRRMIVGPWVNQPENYEGYNGFVGWSGICALRSGRWLLTFSSGYWHFSPPLSYELLENEESRKLFEGWQKIGMPFIIAPRGGRTHLIYSDDKGKTWSRPEVLIDTEIDDRSPTIIEANDGTLLCTFFSGQLPSDFDSFHMHSGDGGKTWSKPVSFPAGSNGGFSNGPALQLKSGRILCCVGGVIKDPAASGIREVLNICASDDNGRNFYLLSKLDDVEGNEGFGESGLCELEDGMLMIISRRKGPVFRSEDGGKTWSEPVMFGMDIFDPHVMLFPNGVLACFHGSYKGKGIRVILSKDNGHTWYGPEEGVGYAIDPTVYGYCHAMLLEDGSAYIVYLHTGGHASHDARTEAIWGLRMRPHDDAKGIDILPAPGSAADFGEECVVREGIRYDGGDPALGNLM
jgi:hypothetical protein